MRVDISVVKERYAKMSDEEFIRTTTTNARGLTPVAVEVIAYEVDRRQLPAGIFEGVEAQNREQTPEEIAALCEVLRGLHCPTCASREPLNGTFSREVRAILLSNRTTDRYTVACPTCLDKATSSALSRTLVMGWWSVTGFIRTLGAIAIYFRHRKHHHDAAPSPALRKFAALHVGALVAFRGDQERLQAVIATDPRI